MPFRRERRRRRRRRRGRRSGEPTSKAERINQFADDKATPATVPDRRYDDVPRTLDRRDRRYVRRRRHGNRRTPKAEKACAYRRSCERRVSLRRRSRSIRRDRDAITPMNGRRSTRRTSRSPLIATARTYEEFFIREFRGFIDRGSSGSVTRSVNPGRNARTIRVIRITLQPIYVLRGSLDEYRVSPATSMLLVGPLRRIPLARRRAYRSWRKRGERTTRYQEITFRDRATASLLFLRPSFSLFFFIFSRPRSRFANTIRRFRLTGAAAYKQPDSLTHASALTD